MSRMYRLAGAALALGSLAWLVSLLWGDTVFEGFRPSHVGDSSWGLVALLELGGGLLAVTGFVGMFARQSGRVGQAGVWGFGLGMMSGMVFGAGFGTVFLVALPAMSASDRGAWDFFAGAQPPAAIGELFLVASLLYVLSTVLLGWATARAEVWPAWSGWALAASGVLALLITIARLAGMNPAPLVGDLPFFIWMLLGIYWGWQLMELMRPAAMRTAASGASA